MLYLLVTCNLQYLLLVTYLLLDTYLLLTWYLLVTYMLLTCYLFVTYLLLTCYLLVTYLIPTCYLLVSCYLLVTYRYLLLSTSNVWMDISVPWTPRQISVMSTPSSEEVKLNLTLSPDLKTSRSQTKEYQFMLFF